MCIRLSRSPHIINNCNREINNPQNMTFYTWIHALRYSTKSNSQQEPISMTENQREPNNIIEWLMFSSDKTTQTNAISFGILTRLVTVFISTSNDRRIMRLYIYIRRVERVRHHSYDIRDSRELLSESKSRMFWQNIITGWYPVAS